MHRFAHPARFMRIADRIAPITGVATLLCFVVGLYWSLGSSPPDYQQGETVRIMYIHVPAAWMAIAVYTNIFIASLASLIWRHPLADIVARACGPMGLMFTAVCLVSGSLWGRPTWGTYWAWDARLTSVLILFFIYLGYIALWEAIEDRQKAGQSAAILAIVGFVNIPIIKFSVEWWSSLHQKAGILTTGRSHVDPHMLKPLLCMALAYFCYFITILIWRIRAEIYQQRLDVHHRLSESPMA